MTEKEKLKEILFKYFTIDYQIEELLKYLLDRGVVVLPCKVGDTVYRRWYIPCHKGEPWPERNGCCGCKDHCDIHRIIEEYTVPSLKFIVENFVEGNQNMYFLTREEAENTSKEKK